MQNSLIGVDFIDGNNGWAVGGERRYLGQLMEVKIGLAKLVIQQVHYMGLAFQIQTTERLLELIMKIIWE